MSDNSSKRDLAVLGGSSAAPAAKKFKAEARLGDDRVAAMPVGSNLIEVDGKSCTHEVCWPPGVQGSNDPPKARAGPPAREYPFKLDPFQQTAINALEGGVCLVASACRLPAASLQVSCHQLRPWPHPASNSILDYLCTALDGSWVAC